MKIGREFHPKDLDPARPGRYNGTMARQLDPRNPAFAFMGERECRNTVCFVDAKGRLCWVPHEALKSYFKRELPGTAFADWHKELCFKEFK